ncbi:MAG: ECF transporter S component [Lachnospiraceae bacterium]|nr:ECF transporter S component [Lachnospiraceae bacterium]
MKQTTTGKLTLTALFAAVICVATVTIRIPIAPTNGYIHLGDAFVILAGILLGSGYAAVAAGTGAMFADIIGGYFIYAPITFIIKALMAVSVWLIFSRTAEEKYREPSLPKQRHETVRCFIGGIAASIINVSGYFIFEWVLYGATALLGIPGNIIQSVSGLVISTLLYPVVKKAYQLVRAEK